MKRLIVVGFALFALTNLAGCAHLHTASDDQAFSGLERDLNVSIDAKEARPGDELRIIQQSCTGTKLVRDIERPSCKVQEVGRARVLANVDAKTARVRLPENVVVDSQTRFENIEN